ncbi:hypothetical protein CONPUDRAFT_160260 [Coniophora puteana RWD-64-598 SS2]|uniref:Magnesium-dependent phosphatase-1 n=1 Tax=Coniophora puteana (strain RWD-64-598) TaxID=741705 RepID=R7SDJ1_CONPW|nr:uncharacterized protein CONPUDRAFT_160260 [Coniophora puteana RWD-64-598 SS2]EIW74211.1 hypothetical protein CONPUDRAFT_160260 [Coniophora puteana RWD-64-598 SS2]
MTARYPKLVALDLDFTIWPLDIDWYNNVELDKKDPTKVIGKGYGSDRTPIALYEGVPEVLRHLKERDVEVVACSRSWAPEVAKKALGLFRVPFGAEGETISALECFTWRNSEIEDTDKRGHFRRVQASYASEGKDIPFEEMLFFDDATYNGVVADLGAYLFFLCRDYSLAKEIHLAGVTFHLLSRKGLDMAAFEAGLEKWRRNIARYEAGEGQESIPAKSSKRKNKRK